MAVGIDCRSVRRAAEASPQAALAILLIALPENAHVDGAGRHVGVGGGRLAQCAFAMSVQTTSTGHRMTLLVALCSLRLIMCGF